MAGETEEMSSIAGEATKERAGRVVMRCQTPKRPGDLPSSVRRLLKAQSASVQRRVGSDELKAARKAMSELVVRNHKLATKAHVITPRRLEASAVTLTGSAAKLCGTTTRFLPPPTWNPSAISRKSLASSPGEPHSMAVRSVPCRVASIGAMANTSPSSFSPPMRGACTHPTGKFGASNVAAMPAPPAPPPAPPPAATSAAEPEFVAEQRTVLQGLDALDAGARKITGPSGKEYYGAALLCGLWISHQPRKAAIQIIESRWFDPLILCTILTNCVTMAWQSPLDPPGTPKADLIDVLEWLYLYIFTFELVAKIFAYGFVVQEGSYLRDAWCQLDFVVVSLAWIPIVFPSFGNYSVIRSVRALRPLRALKRVPGMPQMISAVMAAFPKLGNVVALCGFIFLVFGIVGMELFKGALHHRCALDGFVETPGHPIEARRLALLVEASATASQAPLLSTLNRPMPISSASVGPATAAWMLKGRLLRGGGAKGVSTDGAIGDGGDGTGGNGSDVTCRRRLKGGGPSAGGGGDPGGGGCGGKGDPSQVQFDTEQFCNPTHNAPGDAVRRHRRLKGGGASTGGGTVSHEGVPHDHSLCDPGTTCSYFDQNINYNLQGFDDIGKAFLLILQCTTFDTWTDAMYALMDAFSPYVWVYFVLIALLGGIFVVQLFLAVIFEEFLKAQQLEAAKQDMQRQRKLSLAGKTPRTTDAPAPPYAEEEKVLLLEAGQPSSDGTTNPPTATARASSRNRPGCCDCAPAVGTWRFALGEQMNSSLVGNLSTGLVLYNVALMCMAYEGMSNEYAEGLEMKATLVSWAFIVEMALKLVGMGCAAYWADGWNQLDGSIVTMSIVEMVMTAVFAGSGVKLSFLRILRMLRVLRILRLMKSWKGLYKIVVTFGKAAPQMGNIFVLMFLSLLIFSLLGMQLFAGMYNPSTGYSREPCLGDAVCSDPALLPMPRYHFDYFMPAMLTCFIMMTGGWVDIVGPAYVVKGGTAVMFCVTCVVVGCFVILNLFIAVLLNAFGEDDEEEEDEGSKEVESAETNDKEDEGAGSGEALGGELKGDDDTRSGSDETVVERPWPEDHSLFCFGPRHGFRRACQQLVVDPRFDQVIVSAIVISSICLAMDVPRLPRESLTKAVLHRLDYFWTLLFFCEMMSKMVSRGFLAYVKDPWNLLDLLIVTISFLVLLAVSEQEAICRCRTRNPPHKLSPTYSAFVRRAPPHRCLPANV